MYVCNSFHRQSFSLGITGQYTRPSVTLHVGFAHFIEVELDRLPDLFFSQKVKVETTLFLLFVAH